MFVLRLFSHLLERIIESKRILLQGNKNPFPCKYGRMLFRLPICGRETVVDDSREGRAH